jgi:hypothetical protein
MFNPRPILHRVSNLRRPGPHRLLGDDLLVEQRLRRALIRRRNQFAGTGTDELGDMVHHRLLVVLSLPAIDTLALKEGCGPDQGAV